MDTYLFAGDSLTEGVYGESYVERIARALYRGWAGLEGEVVNAGRGGDTIAALLDRIEEPLRRYQPRWVIFAIGLNDVWFPWLGEHSIGWRLSNAYRRLRGRTCTTDLDRFAAAYRSLVDTARTVADARVLACTLPPIGEQLAAPVNRRLARLNGVIKHVAADRRIPVADVWQAFVEELAARPRSAHYMPGEWLFAWLDRRRLRSPGVTPDSVAERRHLWLTLDGIHLNSRGADLWAKTVLAALAQARGTAVADAPSLARRLDLPCFRQGPLTVCHSPGWEARAQEVSVPLAEDYERLAELTAARPTVHLAVLHAVHWKQSGCPSPYPAPAPCREGTEGAVLLPDAYPQDFLRAMHLPEALAAWPSRPPSLMELTSLAQATALADLLGIQALARLFLQELQVAPADPELGRLFAAYLTYAVLRSRRDATAASLASGWEAWTQVLFRAGHPEGQVRHQAQVLYEQHGDDLAADLSSSAGQDRRKTLRVLETRRV